MKLKRVLSFATAACTLLGISPSANMQGAKVISSPISEYYENLGTQNYIAVNKAVQIEVDGNGEDWADFPAIEVTKTRTYIKDVDINNKVSVKVAWDDEYFYYYAEVYDEIFKPRADSAYWQGDCLQICMGLPEEVFGDEIGFSWDEANQKPYVLLPSALSDKADLVKSAFSQSGNTQRYEMAVPWTVPFDARPELFKFCLLTADDDGLGRGYVTMMETGIEELKQNVKFPYLVLCDESTNGLAWVNGSVSVNTGEMQEYSINILNFGEARKQNIKVVELEYDEEVDIAAQSWTTIPVTANTGGVPRKMDMFVETDDSVVSFHKEVKVYPTYEVYRKRIEAIKAELEKIDVLIKKCKVQNISTDYEEINANVVREFLNYVVEDIQKKDSDRMEYTLEKMEELCEQAYSSLKDYILGSALPFNIPRNVSTEPLEVKGSVFYGMTEDSEGNREERPVFLIGYGHGEMARKELTKFPGVGGNYMQMEIGPNSYIQPVGAVPDWIGGNETTVYYDDVTQSTTAHLLTNSIKQCVPVVPKQKYRLSFDARGSATESWTAFGDWNDRKNFSLSKEMKRYSFELAAPLSGVFTIRFYVKGEMFVDNIEVRAVDENGVEFGENPVVNGDFEKAESDSRFICDFSPMLSAFSDVYKAGQSNVMVSFLLSPHYFPSWVRTKYPSIYIKSIRSYDLGDEVIQDLFRKMATEMARVLKNLGAVNDICVHNEDRFPLYMDMKYLPRLREFLRELYHDDIEALNAAYQSNYTSFDEVPMPEGLARNSATYDLALLTNKVVLEGRQVSYDAIKAVWPEVTVHGKLQSPQVLSTASTRFTQGQEPVGEGRLFGVHGMDGGVTYQGGEFMDDKFKGSNPLGIYMAYDYFTSDLSAPILNTEDHIDKDGDYTMAGEIAQHCARYMWEASIHGRAASAIWTWARSTDTAQNHVRGHVNYRPDQMAQIGRTALDVNRLSWEIEALNNVKRNVQILYAPASKNRDYLILNAMEKVYNAASYSGQKTYILTDGIYDNLNHSDLLIVPGARYVTEQFLHDVLDYLNAGNEVVLLGDFCLELNEYGQKHDPELLRAIYEKSTIIPVEYEMDTSYSYVGVNSEANVGDSSHILPNQYEVRDLLLPIFEKHSFMDIQLIDAQTGELTRATTFLYTAYKGKMLLDISFYGDYNVNKSYKVLYNGKEVKTMRELRSGRLIEDGIVELDASTPQLLQFHLQ